MYKFKLKSFSKIIPWALCVLLIAAFTFSFLNSSEQKNLQAVDFSLDEQAATVSAINKNMPAVVSISVYKDLDSSSGLKIEEGAGTGFIVSSDGLLITNKHVVETNDPENTEYRVLMSSGKKYYAKLLDKDPISDLAALKIYDQNLPYVELGDSDALQVGGTVVAIGNVLGKYQNSVTKGIVSGLGRDFVARGTNGEEQVLNNTIQTDAEINRGNSGGPLIDLHGRVVGVNVAMDASGDSIGFAIPINTVRPVINSVKENNRISRPRLGVRYMMIDPQIAHEKNLPRKEGALIVSGEEDKSAVVQSSAANKAGLREGDIIFEVNAIKINKKNNLLSVVQRYKPGDRIGMKVQRENKVFIKTVTLDEFESE